MISSRLSSILKINSHRSGYYRSLVTKSYSQLQVGSSGSSIGTSSSTCNCIINSSGNGINGNYGNYGSNNGSNTNQRSYHSLLRTWNNNNCQASIIKNDDHNHDNNNYINNNHHRLNQIRHMGRNDGNKAFYKPRKTTKKQRKKYYKRKRDEYQHKVGRHSKPGSVAGPLREIAEIEKEDLIALGAGERQRGLLPENEAYNYGDALIDDIMGNTADLLSAPTPKAIHMGKQYNKHYAIVSGLMDDFNAQQLAIEENSNDNDNDENEDENNESISNETINENENENNAISTPLPTDKQISLLLRSYRDKYSTKHNPMGIAKALQHLLSDIQLTTDLFGPRTYAALIYCAASPTEGRRIIQMMVENSIKPNQYVYSILVDLYAQRGDFRGADGVLTEMSSNSSSSSNTNTNSENDIGGPTLPAYTSLLAACYKVINTPSIPTSIKAEAGTLAWERWKECFKNDDIEPDVMAYGAIIRIMAARGLPERAINLIEEMYMMDVKPTTLVFTAALRSVARSHANALRFEGGFSKKDKRRESITAHHGKLTRKIVILAEQVQVEQDDGFTSALMICAATAGDSATAKAIYLASEVRKLDHLRSIGGDDHLKLFYEFDKKMNGDTADNDDDNEDEDDDDLLAGFESELENLGISDGETTNSNDSSLIIQDDELTTHDTIDDITTNAITTTEFDESEENNNQLEIRTKRQRKDTRKLSALLRANANAVEKRGLGNMWQGRDNKGFLCENSLRLINLRYAPKYVDKSIPGISGTDSGLASMEWDDDEDAHMMPKRLRRKKFMGLVKDTEDNTIDDLDPTLYRLFVEDEDILFGTDKEEGETSDESYESHFQLDGSNVKEIPSEEFDNDKSNPSQNNNDSNEKITSDDEVFSENDQFTATINDGNESNLKIEGSKEGDAYENSSLREDTYETNSMIQPQSSHLPASIETDANDNNSIEAIAMDENKDELDLILYGMPQSRIEKVRNEFTTALAEPSMLQLVPLLRENMPEVIDMKWLREKNVKDSMFVMDKAKEDGIVDTHLLNNMLQVLAKSGKIDSALEFYDEQYSLHNRTPKPISDRTVFQMLVNGHRITKALDFKGKVEKGDKHLDLLSYGSLIEYFGNNGQIGSAITMLKECKKIHGSPPGEKSLKQIRIKCRQQNIEESVGLVELIGKDPNDWIRKGENEFKREYSKKGRRQINVSKNKMTHI